MYRKILNDPLQFSEFIGSDARSVLTGLLTRDSSQRLGLNGAEEIKKHPFFHKHIDFKKLLEKKVHPPFKPSVTSAMVSFAFSFGSDTILYDHLFRISLTLILILHPKSLSIA